MDQGDLIKQLLIKYWGHSSFREKQEEIILSVLEGKDTLALLPTGGGKSICFQIPALAIEGICLVVSPLIALMQDQVLNLKKRGIKAIAIHSAMSKREIDIALDNAAYGDFKFLYVSPERLETEIFLARLPKMKVNLVAVDEAHCISQWGYDFRPSYLKIAKLRERLKAVPFLALTATATPSVIIDIQEKLLFKEKNSIQKSFERKNLAYVVLKTEDQLSKLLSVLDGVKGSGIVYVNSRRKTKEITKFLQNHSISSDYYHAGLSHLERSEKQLNWTSNRSRVMVATNAFGMGIDKSNVRFVVHLDITESLEAYFQEAGRAGRDERKAYAVKLITPSMISNFREKIKQNFPEIDFIKNVYQALSNYFQIPVGGGLDQSFDFDIKAFSSNYKLNIIQINASLHFLEKEGYITISENFSLPSRIHISLSKTDLYKFQVENKNYDSFIKTLLRTYGGLLEGFIKISEFELSKNLNTSKERIVETLERLHELNVLVYEKQSKLPKITYSLARIDQRGLLLSKKNYKSRKELALTKAEAVIDYIENTSKCRSEKLLTYFGEKNTSRCGICDLCLERNKLELNKHEFSKIQNQIITLIENKKNSLDLLTTEVKGFTKEKIISVLDYMIDSGILTTDGFNFDIVEH